MLCENIITFIKTAEAGSINKAAGSLYISPTAVMKQLNTLEDALNARLFVRTNHGVTLTEAGRILFEDSVKIAKLCGQTITKVKSVANAEILEQRQNAALQNKKETDG